MPGAGLKKRGCRSGIPAYVLTVKSDFWAAWFSDLEIAHHLLELFGKGQQFPGVEVDG